VRTKTVVFFFLVSLLTASLSAHTQNPQWQGRIDDESVSYNVFDENGVFLKVLHMPISPRIIMNGFIYKIGKDPDTEYPRIIRYKIINWSQIIKGI